MTMKHDMILNDQALDQINGGWYESYYEVFLKFKEKRRVEAEPDYRPDFTTVMPVDFDEPEILIDPKMFQHELRAAE